MLKLCCPFKTFTHARPTLVFGAKKKIKMPSLEDLPFELIEIIMTYLNPSDRRDVSLVSKKLAAAADGVSKITLKFDHYTLDDAHEPLNLFYGNSTRRYTRLYIDGSVRYSSMERFYNDFIPHLTELTLAHFEPESISNLATLLRHCRESLESLTIIVSCDSENDIELSALELEKLSKLKRLCFKDVLFSEESFDRFLKPILSRLESLQISGFYYDDEDMTSYMLNNIQGSTLTELKIFEVHASRMIHWDSFGLQANRHGFKKFSIAMIHAKCWEPYLRNNTEIIEFGDPKGVLVTPECLNLLVQLLPKLQVLKINIDRRRPLENLDFLCEFDELREFSCCFGDGDMRQVGGHKLHGLKKNLKMKSFTLQNFELCHLCFKRIVESYPNLRVLDIQKVNINDEELQFAITKFTLLRELFISKCSLITNSGLRNISSLKGLRKLKIQDTAITELTLNLPELFELSMIDLNIPNIVFVDCFSMEYLNIRGCEHITYESLVLMLRNMRRLKMLHIYGCIKVSSAILEYLVTYLPKLQYIGFDDDIYDNLSVDN